MNNRKPISQHNNSDSAWHRFVKRNRIFFMSIFVYFIGNKYWLDRITKTTLGTRRSQLLLLFSKSMRWQGGWWGSWVEGSVSPAVEVDPWKDAGLARNSRVDLVVRQHHRVHLQPSPLRWWASRILCDLDVHDVFGSISYHIGSWGSSLWSWPGCFRCHRSYHRGWRRASPSWSQPTGKIRISPCYNYTTIGRGSKSPFK